MTLSGFKFGSSQRFLLALVFGLLLTWACSSDNAITPSTSASGGASSAGASSGGTSAAGAPVTSLGGADGNTVLAGRGGAPPTGGVSNGGENTGGVSNGGASTGGSFAGGTSTGGVSAGGVAGGGVAGGGSCPSGYVGASSTTCTPTLTGLVLSAGTLAPALADDVTAYAASVRLGSQTITLTPTIPVGASVTVNDQAVESGSPWTSPLLNLGANQIAIVVSQLGHPSRSYTLTVTRSVRQEAYVKASNAEESDVFGSAVALSADGATLAVGAFGERSNATGVDGNQADNSATSSGAVYVFTRSGSSWTQQAYIKASNSEAGDYFGSAIALSADGDTLAVGALNESSNATGVDGNQADNSAPSSGALYVFTRSAGTWAQQAYIKASNSEAGDYFGSALALSADGDTLAIGAYFESSNATGVDGNQTDNSAPSSGAVYVFTRSAGTWAQQAYIKASNTETQDSFGSTLALSADGGALAVGALYESSNAVGVNGNQADNAAQASGAVYVFTRSGSSWAQQAYVKASNPDAGDYFGTSLAFSADGSLLAVGTRGEDSNATGVNGNELDNSTISSGAVYVFTGSGGTWAQQAYIKASNPDTGDNFGSALALSADGATLAVAAPREDSSATGVNGNQADNSASSSGAVYLFARSSNNWTQQAYIKASNTGGQDAFGSPLALSADGGTLAVGALNEDSNATGINGNQADNSALASGAVYVCR